MTIEVKFRGAALVSGPNPLVVDSAQPQKTLGGTNVARPVYVVSAQTLVGVQSFAGIANAEVPAVLGYDLGNETVFDAAAAQGNNGNAATIEAVALAVKSWEVIIIQASADSIHFVLPSETLDSNVVPTLTYTSRNPPVSGDPANGATLGRLVLTSAITPFAAGILEGKMRSNLTPEMDDNVNVGGLGKFIKTLFAKKTVTDDVQIGTSGESHIVHNATQSFEFALPNGMASGAGRKLATTDISSPRAEDGGRSLRGHDAVAGVGTYKLVGEAKGNLIEILDVSSTDCFLFARDINHFGFLVDGNGQRAIPTTFADGDNRQVAAAIGNDARRTGTDVTRIVSSQQPGDVPAFYDIKPCRFINVGTGIVCRFGTIEGGPALPNNINTYAKMYALLENAANNVVANTPQISGVFAANGGAFSALSIESPIVVDGVLQPKNNMAATTAPAATDNAAKGYENGAIWQNNTNGYTYIKQSETGGVAVWRILTPAPSIRVNADGTIASQTGGMAVVKHSNSNYEITIPLGGFSNIAVAANAIGGTTGAFNAGSNNPLYYANVISITQDTTNFIVRIGTSGFYHDGFPGNDDGEASGWRNADSPFSAVFTLY